MIKHKGLEAFLAKPQRESQVGVVVIQEWWGMNDQMKSMAQRFAVGDYDKQSGQFQAYAIVPDLYHSKRANYDQPDEAKHMMNNLDFQGAVKEIQVWIDYLKVEYGVKHIGVTGFCLGGALTLASASKLTDVQAAAPFYGIPDKKYFPPQDIKCPLLLTFGALDDSKGFSSPSDLEGLVKELKAPHTVNLVNGVGHAFMNEARPDVYQKDKAIEAFSKACNFFMDNLK